MPPTPVGTALVAFVALTGVAAAAGEPCEGFTPMTGAQRKSCAISARLVFATLKALPDVAGLHPSFSFGYGPLTKADLSLSRVAEEYGLSRPALQVHYGSCPAPPGPKPCDELEVEVQFFAEPFAAGMSGPDRSVKRTKHLSILMADSVDPRLAEAEVAIGDVASDDAELAQLTATPSPGPRAVCFNVAGAKPLVRAFAQALPADTVLRALQAARAASR